MVGWFSPFSSAVFAAADISKAAKKIVDGRGEFKRNVASLIWSTIDFAIAVTSPIFAVYTAGTTVPLCECTRCRLHLRVLTSAVLQWLPTPGSVAASPSRSR